MEGFTIEKIREGVYVILDEAKASFYVIEGEDRAAVIDTGITKGTKILEAANHQLQQADPPKKKIMPAIHECTNKPVLLIITHLHLDHIYHMDEFEEVYMCHDEFNMGPELVKYHMAGKDLDVYSTRPIDTGSLIDLGNRKLEICKIPGHTPGSVAVYDAKEDLVFTGDAIGSGCGVWLQLPGSTSLTLYRESLIHFLTWLVERGGRMQFWGGHHVQYRYSKAMKDFNPLSLGLLADLIDLVDQVISGKIEGSVMEMAEYLRVGEARYASYGRAELIFSKDKIC